MSSRRTGCRQGHRLKTTSAIAIFTGVLVASSANAQTATPPAAQGAAAASTQSPDSKSSEIAEIIVTAEKREEPLSKTPIAISVLTQDQLTNAGVKSLADITSATPNVQIGQYPFASSIYLEIRGIVSGSFSGVGDQDVGLYIDGVAIPGSRGLGSAFYDLSRVEVLRGPQGTLYGKDATAGNINIITASPEQEFQAEADVGYGNYDDRIAHWMVNIPINDTLAMRFSGVIHENDGYFNTEGTTARNYGLIDDYGGRISALWQPTSNFKWRLSVDDFVSSGTQGLQISTGPNGKPLDGLPVYNQPVSSTPEPFNNINNLMVRSRMDWQVSDNLALSYIFGEQIYKNSFAVDLPTTFYLYGPQDGTDSSETGRVQNQYHEINLSYDTNRIKNILGFTYSDGETHGITNNREYYVGTVSPISTTPASTGDYSLPINTLSDTDSSWGVFDQATYNVTDALHLIGGIRYGSDKQRTDDVIGECFGAGSNYFYAGGPISPSCTYILPTKAQGSWSAYTWKAGVNYDITDKIMSYVSVSTGYKAGGINEFAFSTDPNIEYYRPEHVTNYESGIKGRYLDGKATLNADFFYEAYKDIDVSSFAFDPTTHEISFTTQNAGRAAIWGPELEGSLNITSADKLEGYLNYLHATYTEYNFDGADPFTGIHFGSLAGKELPNAPDISARVQYSHDFLFPNGATLTPMAAVYWQDVSYLRAFNLPVDKVPAYSKTSLRLTYTDQSSKWQLQAYVDNLEDNAVRIGVTQLGASVNSVYAAPRIFGVTATYRY